MECISPRECKGKVRGMEFRWTVPCGNCMPCRITRREQWVTRIFLESLYHEHSWFVTLTYDDAHLPMVEREGKIAVPTLRKADVQRWMKRLRHHLSMRAPGLTTRFFLVGEYGSRTNRPHYHAVLFGISPDYVEELVTRSWSHGFVSVSPLNIARARYVGGYILKKLTGPLSFSDGRVSEFANMSRKPGIGLASVSRILATLRANGISIEGSHSTDGPVNGTIRTTPAWIRWQGRRMPLDPYLRKKLGQAAGIVEEEPLRKYVKASTKHYLRERKPETTARRDSAEVQSERINRRLSEREQL